MADEKGSFANIKVWSNCNSIVFSFTLKVSTLKKSSSVKKRTKQTNKKTKKKTKKKTETKEKTTTVFFFCLFHKGLIAEAFKTIKTTEVVSILFNS